MPDEPEPEFPEPAPRLLVVAPEESELDEPDDDPVLSLLLDVPDGIEAPVEGVARFELRVLLRDLLCVSISAGLAEEPGPPTSEPDPEELDPEDPEPEFWANAVATAKGVNAASIKSFDFVFMVGSWVC